MRASRRFRFSGPWALEDRVALSHGGITAPMGDMVPRHGIHATFHGKFVTTLAAGLGGSETAQLTGESELRGIGLVQLTGKLSSNGSLPPPDSGTSGLLDFTSPKHPGSLLADVSGPPTDLSPVHHSTTRLTFTVVKAEGQFSGAADAHGVATLRLNGRPLRGHSIQPVQNGNTVHGHFTLKITES